MKKLLILLVYCLFIGQSFGQSNGKSNDIIGQSFVTKTSISVKAYDPSNKGISQDLSFLLNDGIKFYIYDIVENGYVISVWNYSTNLEKEYFYKNLPNINENKIYEPFNEEKPNYYKILKSDVGIKSKEITKDSLNASKYKYKDLAYIDSWANNSHFFISLKDFNDKCESIYPHKRGFTWGFLTLPIKARFGNSKAPFTFEEKINFGISAGVKWQHVNTVYSASNLLGGVSVGGVKIDKDNSASAISLSGGYMYQYDKFQIGIFTGVDFIDKSNSVNWGYQGKPWVGFAIGVSLFGESKTTAESKKQDQ